MIIWSGLGFVVAVIGFGALVLTEYLAEKVTGDAQFYQHNSWAILLAMLLAAGLTYAFHTVLAGRKGRVVIDKETGHEVTLRANHSLFFVPVKWWPAAFVGIGVLMAFTRM